MGLFDIFTRGLNRRVRKLEQELAALKQNSVLQLDGVLALNSTGSCATVTVNGANLQITNGLGKTDSVNGCGNLIIGYNESRVGVAVGTPDGVSDDVRTGSHNIVVGPRHNYPSFAGIVSGEFNSISGEYSSVTAGRINVAGARFSSITGGVSNYATGEHSSVLAGEQNKTSGLLSSVSAGRMNEAQGEISSVNGGEFNRAIGAGDSILGGDHNFTSGGVSCVSGGNNNNASGFSSSVCGGHDNNAASSTSTILGGGGLSTTNPEQTIP